MNPEGNTNQKMKRPALIQIFRIQVPVQGREYTVQIAGELSKKLRAILLDSGSGKPADPEKRMLLYLIRSEDILRTMVLKGREARTFRELARGSFPVAGFRTGIGRETVLFRNRAVPEANTVLMRMGLPDLILTRIETDSGSEPEESSAAVQDDRKTGNEGRQGKNPEGSADSLAGEPAEEHTERDLPEPEPSSEAPGIPEEEVLPVPHVEVPAQMRAPDPEQVRRWKMEREKARKQEECKPDSRSGSGAEPVRPSQLELDWMAL